MQKTDFLKQVAEILITAEYDAAATEAAITRLSDYLDSLSPEDLQRELDECSDPKKTAQVILSSAPGAKPRRRAARPTPTAGNQETARIPVSEMTQTAERQNTASGIDGETVKIDVVPRPQRQAKPPAPTAPSEEDDASEEMTLHTAHAIKYSDLDRVVAVDPRNRIIFWCVFALLSPVIAILLLFVLALFAAVFLGMAVMVAGCIAALVGVVGIGTGVSLFGLIYGTTQLFSALSAGLYEIGVAISVAGASLFLGILLYNTAIRLMPFLMRYLYIFFCFVMKKAYQLFQFIRRECTGR